MEYRALVGLTNDKTNKTYPAGTLVTVKDFPASVLAAWLAAGKIEVNKGNRKDEQPLVSFMLWGLCPFRRRAHGERVRRGVR